MRAHVLWLTSALLITTACHVDRPIVDPRPQASVGGTIAGIVTTADPKVAVPGRKVTAVEIKSGSRFDATTGANGGYTIKVPEGTYRIDVELRASETYAKRPEPTKITNGDTDSGRDFVITVK